MYYDKKAVEYTPPLSLIKYSIYESVVQILCMQAQVKPQPISTYSKL
jgi:hypothetical protein